MIKYGVGAAIAFVVAAQAALAQPPIIYFFSTNSTYVKPDADDVLLPNVQDAVKANANVKFVVHGYATPADVYDGDNHTVGDVQAFSLKRAQAMADYLRAHGFANVPITTEGDGATNLLEPLSPATDYSAPNGVQDRRVEIEVTPQ